MNNTIIINTLILVFLSTDAAAMKNKLQTSLRYHIVTSTTKESKRIHNMRIDKNKFKKELQRIKKSSEKCFPEISKDITELPTMVFQSFQDPNRMEHYDYLCDINIIETFSKHGLNDPLFDKLDKYKNTHINGYSLFAAALLAKHKDTYSFIQRLKEYEFQPTEKDMEHIQLDLYDNILAKQNVTITFLLSDNQNNLSPLPHDVRREMVKKLISLEKRAY
jgi:hypothetical protein